LTQDERWAAKTMQQSTSQEWLKMYEILSDYLSMVFSLACIVLLVKVLEFQG
jgi:hypothetical protein